MIVLPVRQISLRRTVIKFLGEEKILSRGKVQDLYLSPKLECLALTVSTSRLKKEIETMQKWLNEVEQLICNQQVVGSTPTFCSKTDVFPVYLSLWKNYSASERRR